MKFKKKTILDLGYRVGSNISIHLKDSTSLSKDGDIPTFYKGAKAINQNKKYVGLIAKGYICDFLDDGLEISPVWNPHIFSPSHHIVPTALNYVVEYNAINKILKPENITFRK